MIARDTSLPLVVTVACLWAVIAVGCADRATPPQASAPSATIVAVEGASTTYHTRDWNGKTVTVRMPSQSATDIRGKDAEGTVRGTITAVDPAAHRVRVRTSEGQTIVLAMAPGSLTGLKPGDLFSFTMPEAPRT
jgi:phage baseplate assembly protein gpV